MNNILKITVAACLIAITFVVCNYFILQNRALSRYDSPHAILMGK